METNQDVEVELYEELVGDLNQEMSGVGPSSSTEIAGGLPPSQEPITYTRNAETSLATTPRSALRPQLAGYPVEPRQVAVTMSPERGARMVELQNSDSDTDSDITTRSELMIQMGQSASVVPAVARNDGLDSSVEDRPRSALAIWMTAITTRLDSLWNAFHDSSRTVPACSTPESELMDNGRVVTQQPLSVKAPGQNVELDMTVSFDEHVNRGDPLEVRQVTPDFRTDPGPAVRPPVKTIWHHDSVRKINLDGLNSSRTGLTVGSRTNPENHAEYDIPQGDSRPSSAGQHAASAVTDSGTKTRVVTITRPLQPRTVHRDDNPDIEVVMAPEHDPTEHTDLRHGRNMGKTDRRSLSARPTVRKYDRNKDCFRHKTTESGHAERQKTDHPNPDWKQYSDMRHSSDRRGDSSCDRIMRRAPRHERRRIPDSSSDQVRYRPHGREPPDRRSDRTEKDQSTHGPRHRREISPSSERDNRRGKKRPDKRSDSVHSTHYGRHRCHSCMAQNGDSSRTDSDRNESDGSQRRGRSRGRRRPRRRLDPSPDDGDGDGSDNDRRWYSDDSSSAEDNSVRADAEGRQLRIKLQKFDGTGSWETWWAHFKNCASYNRWTERDKLAFMKGALTGNAAQVLWDTDRVTTGSWKKLVNMLKSRYSGERQAEKYRAELQIRRRRHNESLSELHQDIRRLMALAYPKLTAAAREEIACDHFTNALSDPDFALKVKERTPTSLDEALRIALRLEAWEKSTKMSGQDEDRTDRSRHKIRTVGKQDGSKVSNPPRSDERLTKIETDMTEIATNMNRQYQELKRLISENQPQPKMGHNSAELKTASDMPQTAPCGQRLDTQAFVSAGEGPAQTYTPQTPQPGHFPCWECGMPGHFRRNCPARSHGTMNQTSAGNTSNRGSRKMQDKANVYVKMTLLGKDVPCLVDSGCETTMVPKSLVDRFRNVEIRPTSSKVWAANNTEIRLDGEATLPFCLNEQCLWTTALVSEDVEEVMLGADWLHDYGCVWDFRTGGLSVAGQPAVALTRRGRMKCRRVFVQEYQEIPPRSQVDVTARVTMLSTHAPLKDVMVETRRLRPGLYVGRTLLPPEHRGLKVCVANTTNKRQLLSAGTCLGPAMPAIEVIDATSGAAPDLPKTDSNNGFVSEISKSVLEKLPTGITSEQRRKIVGFLREYSDIYSRGTYDMGRTNLVEHSIDTGSNRPIRQALRRHPRAHLDEIDKQVDGLLQNRLVEPAASPWASNVVLVRKKDDSFRLCVDYRRLNSVTYKDSYPLPHIDTCLGSMNGAVWFSTLDLRSGYHNIPIKESDRDKTAFITRRGCFRYTVMPFGLTCAPSVFQRLMDLVLCGLTYETCLVYLDDIIVFSRDFDSHLERLQEIFSRLRAANLKLHVKKCSLFQRRVDFLGHVLMESGIEVQTEKIQAVKNWPTPCNLTELRSFVGLCSYYRRFISGFADMAAPLHALTRKHARFSWGPEQDEAFKKLKERLITAPILGMPRDDGTYYLDTDASDRGLGAVLSQDQDGREVVLAYASRTLSQPERNYDVTRRELLAVVYGLKVYRQYLLGRQFVIRTDHSALQSLRKTPEPIGQQARWQTFIEQFTFVIMHRPGTRHRNADALSRRPVSESGSDEEESEVCAAVTANHRPDDRLPGGEDQRPVPAEKSMACLQREDPDIGPILRLRLRQINQPSPEEVLSESEAVKILWGQWHSLVLENGVLYRRVINHGRPAALQLIVPTVRRKEFISQCHQGMTGGHRAFRSTLDQVRRRGFWTGWRRDVERYCRQCHNCSSYHRGRLPRSGRLQPMITGSILERCHVDITGPHPRTPRGSKYILTCVDAFSKWAEAFAIPNKEAKTVARVLVEQIFCRLGTPVALLTDNAGELDGRLMQEICRLLDIDKQHTSYYHPETNSVAERFHGTLNAMMGRTVSEHQKDWDLFLPYVMAAYRATIHQSTNYSPNYLMFAREVRAPVDLVFGIPPEQPPCSYDDYATEVEDRMKQAYSLVRQQLGVAAERMKRRYDIRVRPQRYRRGQWVLYYNPRKFQGKQQKWQRKFSPYLIVKELPPVNYVIQKSKKSRPLIAHVDKLKPWVNDNPPKSWLTGEDHQPGPGNVADIGESGDAGGAVAPTTGRTGTNGDSGDVASGRTPGMVDDDGLFDGLLAQGLGNEGDDAGVGTMVLVNSDNGADAGWSDDVARIGLEESISSGNVVGVGQLEGSVSAGPGKLGNLGVGDGPGRYTSGPNDGDRPSSYTFGHTGRFEDDVNDGDGLRRYIFSPNNGVEETTLRRVAPRQKRSRSGSDTATSSPEPRRTDDKTEQRDGSAGEKTDDAAIAGDPTSTLRHRDRPHRTTRRPARYAE